MAQTYEIFEKLPDGSLLFVEKTESLAQAKVRFFFLTFSSQHEYLVWDSAKGHEVPVKTVAHA